MFHGFVWSRVRSVFYFVWCRQTVFPWKSLSEGPPFFVLFVSNDGVLNLRPHVVAMLSSVTMSWPAKITSKLSMSGLDFSVPVLQSSNHLIWMLFFNFCCLSRFVSRGIDNLLFSESLRSIVFSCKVENLLLSCFRSEASNGFPVKSFFPGRPF